MDGPDPLAPPVDLSEALDAIAEEVMAGRSPEGALRELLRQGQQGRTGLDEPRSNSIGASRNSCASTASTAR